MPKKNDRSGKGRIQVYGIRHHPKNKSNVITMHKEIRTENKYNLDRHAENFQISENWHPTLCVLKNTHKQIRAKIHEFIAVLTTTEPTSQKRSQQLQVTTLQWT